MDYKEPTNYDNQAVLGPDKRPQLLNGNGKGVIPRERDHTLSHRDFFALSLHLSGSTAEEIAELMGYSTPGPVYNILRKKEVLTARQQLLQSLELEFEALQKSVFNVVKTKLSSIDERIQLEAVSIWMKYWGKFLPKVNENQLTAEDVVRQILNQQINVQVNVDTKKGG